jgi:hypothetical protein
MTENIAQTETNQSKNNFDEKFITFFQSNSLAIEATKSISNDREIAIYIIDGTNKDAFTFVKKDGKNHLIKEAAKNPDFTFIIPINTALELLNTNFTSISQIGLRIFEKILTKNENEKIKIMVHIGPLSILTGGYLGVITTGGSDVAKFLASLGLNSLTKIKDTLAKMRQK